MPLPGRLSYGETFYAGAVHNSAVPASIRLKLAQQFEIEYVRRDWREVASEPHRLTKIYLRSDFADFINLDIETSMVTFVPYARRATLIEKVTTTGSWVDFWTTPLRQAMKPGRFLRSILTDDEVKSLSESDIETFANAIKAHSERYKCTVDLVRGDAIADYYGMYGNVGIGSCMQGQPRDFFSLYTSTPDRVALMVAVNGDEELMGRALVWTLDNGTMWMDTIYGSDHIHTLFDQEAEARGIIRHGDGIHCDRWVPMEQTIHDAYPYLDMFRYVVDGVGLYQEWRNDCTGELTSTSGSRSYTCRECGGHLYDDGDDGLCSSCYSDLHCPHCGEEKDSDEEYCETCQECQCRECGDIDRTTQSHNGYCRYCAPDYTCEGCGNVDESVEKRWTNTGRWGREYHVGYCDDCRPDYTCDTCETVVGPDERHDGPDGTVMCTSCLDAATAPEED